MLESVRKAFHEMFQQPEAGGRFPESVEDEDQETGIEDSSPILESAKLPDRDPQVEKASDDPLAEEKDAIISELKELALISIPTLEESEEILELSERLDALNSGVTADVLRLSDEITRTSIVDRIAISVQLARMTPAEQANIVPALAKRANSQVAALEARSETLRQRFAMLEQPQEDKDYCLEVKAAVQLLEESMHTFVLLNNLPKGEGASYFRSLGLSYGELFENFTKVRLELSRLGRDIPA